MSGTTGAQKTPLERLATLPLEMRYWSEKLTQCEAAMADTAAFVESAPWEVLRQANAQLRCCGNCSNAEGCNCRQSDGRGIGCGGEAWAP